MDPADQLLRHEGWRPTAGLMYSWAGERNSYEVQFIRRLNSGNGLMNAQSMTFGSVAARSRFTRRMTGEVRVQVNNQDSFNSTYQQSFRSTWVGGKLTRDFASRFSLRLDYSYVWQSGSGQNLYIPGNHQLVQLSFAYHLVKPVGR